MRTSSFLAFGLMLIAASGAAQTKLDVGDIENHPFSADFKSDGKLRMYLRSGDFRVTGGADNKITANVAAIEERLGRTLRRTSRTHA